MCQVKFSIVSQQSKQPSTVPGLRQLAQQIDQCMLLDRHALRQKLRQLHSKKAASKPLERLHGELIARVDKSLQMVEKRRLSVPKVIYPDLPIAAKRELISKTIAEHQVVVIAGETGSGKTTQLPKICLELGRGITGLIGHTQPRRLAARTVAQRIADELETPLGAGVGYQVRFTDQVSDSSHIKLMTDGILLAEIQQDRYLYRYDTIIIDEAHERSLNIDFLLGYMKQLLPKRPDLKLIITSATIDLDSFSRHFDDAPIIEVSGRTFEVETHYRPLDLLSEEGDLAAGIEAAIDEVIRTEGAAPATGGRPSGDILVFLSGEAEIRDVARHLRKSDWPQCEVLPLYARLSAVEQNKVFSPKRGAGRRIVLATNVAETSLTVAGIRYVIDPGFARISRYSYRTKIQRLPIEAISQASANQRKGRCGRVAEGVCIRLYEQSDFDSRSEFTDPEIKRTNLASVILQMLGMGIGQVDAFPFVDPPDQRMISDGFKLLEELGAVDDRRQLTVVGKSLSRFPVDPRLARMLIASDSQGCLRELLIIVSALSIQDPRERPVEKQQAADEQHRRFWDKSSDFISLVNLWDYYEDQRQALSQGALRKLCKREFLSVMRMREWREVHRQLLLTCRELGFQEAGGKAMAQRGAGQRGRGDDRNRRQQSPHRAASKPGGPPAKSQTDKSAQPVSKYNQQRAELGRLPINFQSIHRALLAGLLSHVATLDEDRLYMGARNRKLRIFPGSALAKAGGKGGGPKWIVSAEIAETSQVYARNCAAIEPEWLLGINDSLFNRSYSEPHWYQRGGQVMAFERLTLYGLTVSDRKRIHYGPIDPVVSRELLIRGALVEGQLHPKSATAKAPFFKHNRQLVAELEALEAKSRRRNILADDQHLFEFYRERIGAEVISLKYFESWRKQQEAAQPRLLMIDRDRLMQHSADHVNEAQFPSQLRSNDIDFALSYRFEPGHVADGLTVTIPIGLLNRVPRHRFEWLVPGLLRDKCIALVKMLPKQQRKQMVPVPEYVDKVLARIKAEDVSLLEVLSRQLRAVAGVTIELDSWQPEQLDDFYRMNFCIVDEQGKPLGQGRNLEKILDNFKEHASDTLEQQTQSRFKAENIIQWDFGELPKQHLFEQAGVTITSYPALVDCGDSVAIELKDFSEQASRASERGLVRLYMLQLPQQLKALRKDLLRGNSVNLQLAGLSQKGKTLGREQWLEDLLSAVFFQVFINGQPLVRTESEFQAQLTRGKGLLMTQANAMGELLAEIAASYHGAKKALKKANELAWAFAINDIHEQLDHLFIPGFIADTHFEQLQQYPRYLQAVQQRVEKFRGHYHRDRQLSTSLRELSEPLYQQWQGTEEALARSAPLLEYRWLLEEFRVSLFAQQLGTQRPVSEKRLRELWKEVKQSLLSLSS